MLKVRYNRTAIAGELGDNLTGIQFTASTK